LVQEVQAFSRDAATGTDAKFGKGSTAYNRYQGDALIKPNPCMAAIEQGPFYAIRLVVGEIGTFAGLATDASCRVRTRDGRAVEGLYVVGNDAASVMGGNYPGAGITLGPCVTFGYVAGMALAQRAEITRGEPQRLAA
jgi:predicted oxidoreductase